MSMVTIMLASMAGLALTPASADEGIAENRQSITYSSEQLLTEDGVEELRQQIARTAREVCIDGKSRFNRFSRETRLCIQTAYADGMDQLGVKVAEARSEARRFARAELEAEDSAQ